MIHFGSRWYYHRKRRYKLNYSLFAIYYQMPRHVIFILYDEIVFRKIYCLKIITVHKSVFNLVESVQKFLQIRFLHIWTGFFATFNVRVCKILRLYGGYKIPNKKYLQAHKKRNKSRKEVVCFTSHVK